MTPGGESNTQPLLLDDNEVQEIKIMLKKHLYREAELAIEYGVSTTLISNINQGIRYFDENEHYPLYKYYHKGLEEYSLLIQLLKTTTKTFKELSQELDIAESTIKKINYGTLWHDDNIEYPIRKINCFNKNLDLIYDLLLNTDLSFVEIAKQTNKSVTTIKRINKGETHHNNKYTYPIRH